jgi:uncharacterized protein YegJ (DUF2314 family)
MKYVIATFLLILTLTACQNPPARQEPAEVEDAQNVYTTSEDDKEMNTAMQTAQKTLDQFDKALESHNYDTNSIALKVGFDAPGGSEYLWLTNPVKGNGVYSGKIANTPERTQKATLGQTVVVKLQNISDWKYCEKGILRGGYTIRVIRNRMTPQERAKLDAELPFKVED